MMTNGFVVIVRNLDDSGILIQAVEDWEEFMYEQPRRLIYCQAVSDLDTVEKEIGEWMESFTAQSTEVNDTIAEIVSSVQWVANDHPLRSFRRLDLD